MFISNLYPAGAWPSLHVWGVLAHTVGWNRAAGGPAWLEPQSKGTRCLMSGYNFYPDSCSSQRKELDA